MLHIALFFSLFKRGFDIPPKHLAFVLANNTGVGGQEVGGTTENTNHSVLEYF